MIRLIGVDDNAREKCPASTTAPMGSHVASEPELRERGDRYYFKETGRTPPGAVYVSPVKLDHEEGVRPAPPFAPRDGPILAPMEAVRPFSSSTSDMSRFSTTSCRRSAAHSFMSST